MGRRWYGIVESIYDEEDKNPGLRISLTLESPLDDLVEQKKFKKDNLKFLKEISEYFEFKEDPLDFLIFIRSLIGEENKGKQSFQHNSDNEILDVVKTLSEGKMDVSLFTYQGMEDLESDVQDQVENEEFSEKTFTMFLPDFIDVEVDGDNVIISSDHEDIIWEDSDDTPRVTTMNLLSRMVTVIVCRIADISDTNVYFE